MSFGFYFHFCNRLRILSRLSQRFGNSLCISQEAAKVVQFPGSNLVTEQELTGQDRASPVCSGKFSGKNGQGMLIATWLWAASSGSSPVGHPQGFLLLLPRTLTEPVALGQPGGIPPSPGPCPSSVETKPRGLPATVSNRSRSET